MTNSEQDKRAYFRIEQELLLEARSVDAYTADHSEAAELFTDSRPLHLFASFHELDQQAAELARGIGEHNPKLAQYLALMNKKLNLLTREVVAQQPSPAGQRPAKASLTEAGIAFPSEKAFYKDSYLALRLIFLPDYTGVVVFAKVVRSEAIKGDLYHIAAKFHRLTAPNRQLLAKHIMEHQLSAQRRAKAPQQAPK